MASALCSFWGNAITSEIIVLRHILIDTMPTDNANSPFIGREKILEQLRDSLQYKNGEHARAALWGLGGSG